METKQKYSDCGQKGDESKAIVFGGKKRIPSVRFAKDMQEVILDRVWVEKNSDQPLYYMYRDLAKSDQEAEKIQKKKLRYDVLASVSVNLGQEFNKTAGHYHSVSPNAKFSYPELYEIIEGEVYCLMQKMENGRVSDVYAVKANSGDKIIVPPNYGHFTFFLSDKSVKMSNWTSGESLSDYDKVKQKHGAAYYVLIDKKEKTDVHWEKNANYTDVPPLRFLAPTNFEDFGLVKGVDMYGLVNNLEKLDYLNNPQNYSKLWERVLNNKV